MAMDAELYRMPTRPTITDPDTGEERTMTVNELRNADMDLVGTADNGDEVILAAPNADVLDPPDIVRLRGKGWTWDNDTPSNADAGVREAIYESTDADGNVIGIRAKKQDVPDGATVLQTDIPPVRWAGDV